MKPVDWIVLTLSLSVGSVILLSVVGIMVNELEPNTERTEVMRALTASMVAIVSMYVGARLNGRD